jgi:hypothetical protein
MSQWTYDRLEPKYKARGSAKILKGEFYIQDLETNRRFDLNKQPWGYVMKAGQKRCMSIKFAESGQDTFCPHCGTDNETIEGQPTTWYATLLPLQIRHDADRRQPKS